MSRQLFKVRTIMLSTRAQALFNIYTDLSWAIPKTFFGDDANTVVQINSTFNALFPRLSELQDLSRDDKAEVNWTDKLAELLELAEDYDDVQELIEDLCINYVDAIPDRGEIEVEGYNSATLVDMKHRAHDLGGHMNQLSQLINQISVPEFKTALEDVERSINQLHWALHCMQCIIADGIKPEASENPGTTDDWLAAWEQTVQNINGLWVAAQDILAGEAEATASDGAAPGPKLSVIQGGKDE